MSLLHKYKRAFLLAGMAVCIAAMVITINPDYRPSVIAQSLGRLMIPLQTGATTAGNWISSRVSLLWEMNHLQQENALLRERVGWLEVENQLLQLAGEENQRLTELLYIRQRYAELPVIGARIISWDHSGWFHTFDIDRGSNDGLARNMAVIGTDGGGGLVGTIQQVWPTHSRVTAILDDRFRVAVQAVRTEDEGVIHGDSTLMQQGLVRMQHISATAQIMAGDEVITSVISMYPPGIRVGMVVDVQPTPDGLAQYALISPWANVRRLEQVIVVTQLVVPEDISEDISEDEMIEFDD